METLYKEASDQANFRAIFENQKEKIMEVFEGDLIYPHSGGYFLLGSALFFDLTMYIDEGKISAFILDIHNMPIKIENLVEFKKEVRSCYTESLNKYAMSLARLKKSRNVPTLTKMHELEDDVEI